MSKPHAWRPPSLRSWAEGVVRRVGPLLALALATCKQPASTAEERSKQAQAPAPTPAAETAVAKPAVSKAASPPAPGGLPLQHIELPPGFRIDVFVSDLENARAMSRGDRGTIFVGSRKAGKVYAVVDADGDMRGETVHVLAEGLDMPNGVAFREGSLFVAEVSRVTRFDGIEDRLANPPKAVVVNDTFPDKKHHGWKYLRFGPDGKLYVPVGAPCNICKRKEEIFASITRMNADGSEREVFAHGVRNTVGFDWHPVTKELWFSDNGRDWLGDDAPNDELNHAPTAGLHFGYPHCHAGDLLDPKFGEGHDCASYRPPAQKLGAHVAGLGVRFYTGDMFPAEYRNQIFLAEHGSWNRSSKVGYRVALIRLDGDKAISYEPFATGWLQGEEPWGRPVDVLVLPDGSILVSDDYGNAIYRISYAAPK